jgi:UDP-glucose 4-epimerase
MTSYFVTGGAGFIGSHFVDRLLAQPDTTVVAYDNLSNSDLRWLHAHVGNANLRVVVADVLDTARITHEMAGTDVLIHLASSVDMRRGLAEPRLDMEQCIVATSSALEAARSNGVKTVIFSSSSTVYGEPVVVPTPESAGPAQPISLYGAGKLGAEGLLSAYSHLYGLDTYAFRFGNVVGARMNHGVIYDFITKLQADPHHLEILGDGNQAKNYFLVEDCIEGILTCSRALGPGSHVLNLGCDGTVQVREIAQIVTEESGLSGVVFTFLGGERGWPGDVPLVHFDLERAHSLGWRASIESADAVRECARRLIADLGSSQPQELPAAGAGTGEQA